MSIRRAARKKSGAWFLYIVECRDGTLYTGITNDLDRRIEQHNSGKASRYTRSRLPVNLVYRERCRGRSGALKKECRIKAFSRAEKEAYIKAGRIRMNSAAEKRGPADA